MILANIRTNIKRLRRFRGITQREMAMRLYMDERTYAKMERGVNKSMDVRLLSSIADILKTDLATLLQHTAASEEREESLPQEGAPAAAAPDSEQTLIQEIRSLKEELKALIDFQKKAIQLLALAVPDPILER
ncbi:helix-turn-helix domain-containing protein [Taibaiella koreensis]|uniref:helix-turn-helix domain-containing protein n=1 Tax=Taibaiella koreensis TaxID=1268548 RepID=UPI000E5A07B8|nr:helix-turn-helix transcriptional regulator [Taibaiella koreensis]